MTAASALAYDLWDARSNAPLTPSAAFAAVCWCEWAAAVQRGSCAYAARVYERRGFGMTDADAVDWACVRLCAWLDAREREGDGHVPPWVLRVVDACVDFVASSATTSAAPPAPPAATPEPAPAPVPAPPPRASSMPTPVPRAPARAEKASSTKPARKPVTRARKLV